MSKPNTWRDKRQEQHLSHNRKPGAAGFWKQSRNRYNRRKVNKINTDRAEKFKPFRPTVVEPLKPSKTRPKPETNFAFEEFLTEEQISQLERL